MPALKPHSFTLGTDVPLDLVDDAVERLYGAGCDDATPVVRGGRLLLNFDREARSYEDAVQSAIADMARAGVRAVRVEPDGRVTERSDPFTVVPSTTIAAGAVAAVSPWVFTVTRWTWLGFIAGHYLARTAPRRPLVMTEQVSGWSSTTMSTYLARPSAHKRVRFRAWQVYAGRSSTSQAPLQASPSPHRVSSPDLEREVRYG
jgi:hypothetical protein